MEIKIDIWEVHPNWEWKLFANWDNGTVEVFGKSKSYWFARAEAWAALKRHGVEEQIQHNEESASGIINDFSVDNPQ